MLPGVPSVPDCTHSRGMSPYCRARSARCYMEIQCLLLAAMAVNVRSPSGLGALGCRGRWDATCIDCGVGGERDAGFGEAGDCAVMVERPNCPARNGGFFEYGVALLQGPRTLSRCLLEKVELGRLAAALAKQQGSSRPPKIVTFRAGHRRAQYQPPSHKFDLRVSACTRATTMSSEPFYLRY
jgi:hypothetical protein